MQNVFVFIYNHNYGTDTGVYATRELALKNAAFIMLEWWDDLEDRGVWAKMILKALKAQDYEEALRLWNDAMGGDESMSIEEHTVSQPSEKASVVVTLASVLAAIEETERQHAAASGDEV